MLGGGLGKKEGVVFLRGGGDIDTPMQTMNIYLIKKRHSISLAVYRKASPKVSKSISIKGIQIFSILYQLQFYEAKNTGRQKYLQR